MSTSAHRRRNHAKAIGITIKLWDRHWRGATTSLFEACGSESVRPADLLPLLTLKARNSNRSGLRKCFRKACSANFSIYPRTFRGGESADKTVKFEVAERNRAESARKLKQTRTW